MPVTLSIKTNKAQVERDLQQLAMSQIPYATALALTDLAKKVRDAEKKNILKVFPTATPFTVASVGSRGATKSQLTSRVFMREIAAEYLEPFEFGGKHYLNAAAILYPKTVRLNQYGNIPMRTISRLKGRKDIFIGAVRTRAGKVNGVWQRIRIGSRSRTMRGIKSLGAKLGKPQITQLKLLIRFGDSLQVRQHLNWFALAKQVLNDNADRAFGQAMTRALQTRR